MANINSDINAVIIFVNIDSQFAKHFKLSLFCLAFCRTIYPQNIGQIVIKIVDIFIHLFCEMQKKMGKNGENGEI